MNKTMHSHQNYRGQNPEEGHPPSPYWRRVHHHWYFWVGMLLMLIAIVNYVMTEDLSGLPRSQPQRPPLSIDGK